MQKITVDLSKLSTHFQRDRDSDRVETGSLQFNEDWPGVFIRGDNAAFYSMQLKQALNHIHGQTQSIDFITTSALKSLVDLLDSCVIIHNEDDDSGVGC